MKITILGTAAYEGYPNPFCECPNCSKARENGEKRLRSTAIINNDLLIDFGPDLIASTQKFDVSLKPVRTLLITHGHVDHLYLPNFGYRLKGFNDSYDELPKMEIVCSNDVGESISTSRYYKDSKSYVRQVTPFEKINSNDYEIISFPAEHKFDENSFGLIYVISMNDKTIFYATDTGPLNEENLLRLEKILDKKINILIMDATLGNMKIDYPYHNTFDSFNETVKRMNHCGLLSPDSKIVAHHFSHHGNPSQKELEIAYSKIGVSVAYDGMELEI